MLKYCILIISLISCIALADGASYGGRHEIAIDGVNVSFRHIHKWGNNKNKKMFFDFANHEKFFTPENDFSYIEIIDRTGNVLFHAPSPAFTKLWMYQDSYFVGISSIKLYNPYQLVVWRGDGTILYKAHISSEVAKFTQEQQIEFKLKFPEADKLVSSHYFSYNNITYCDCLLLGVPNQIGKDAWDYLFKLIVKHPYIYSWETVTNSVYWYKNGEEPQIDKEKNTLTLPIERGDSITIPLDKPIQMLGPRIINTKISTPQLSGTLP